MPDSSIAVALIGTAGLAILVLLVLPGRQRLSLASPRTQPGVLQRFRNALVEAGVMEETPALAMFMFFLGSLIAGIFAVLLLSSLLAFVLGPLLVFLFVYTYIRRRQRRFLNKAAEELVPFLNRISTSVTAGKPAQQAYLDAVEESHWLRPILEDSAAQITAGRRFSHALLETLPLLPLRMWAVFVRQLELYEEVGGNVAESIERAVSQVNTMLQLQAEARADYAIQDRQQKIILIIISMGMGYWVLTNPSRFLAMLSSTPGLVGMFSGIIVMGLGMWFLNKQLRDVERKLAF